MLLNRAACTIVSPNYIAFARTVAASYLEQHPDHGFFVLLVADLADPAPFAGDGFTPIMLHQIGLPDLRSAAMKFDLLELNTCVKPTLMKYLLDRYALETLIYLDPDIYCYAPFLPVFEELDNGATAVLTPHITSPVFEPRATQPSKEQDLLVNGTFNLGFLAVRHCDETQKLLTWWESRCLEDGFNEGRTGLFLDQKWMNLTPGLFDRIAATRDAGCNMAYWNLHERTLLQVQDNFLVTSPVSGRVPLRFFHFSGIVVDDPAMLSLSTGRFTLANRPDLHHLFADYKAAVIANRNPAVEALPYGFDAFSDGTIVTRLARRLYAKHQSHFAGHDPFHADGPFAKFAKQHGLVDGATTPAISTWREFDPRDRRVATVHAVLRLALRVLGPHRYELLMRYLSHISVLRNQSTFLRDAQWPPDPPNGDVK